MQSRLTFLSLLAPCLGHRKLARTSAYTLKTTTTTGSIPSFPTVNPPPLTPNQHLLVDRLVHTLCTHQYDNAYTLEDSIALTIEHSTTVNPTNWSWPAAKAAIAEHILNALSYIIQHSERFTFGDSGFEAFVEVRDQAANIPALAKELAGRHPILAWAVCVALALGTLYVVWPELIAALGFGELGPVEGSFAAAWQSLYGGEVPVGSIFSLLQRLGMTWNGSVACVQGITDERRGSYAQDEKMRWFQESPPADEELQPLVQYD